AMNTAVAQEVFFLSQTGVGIMGNSLPNMLYFSSFLLGSKPKPTDLVIIHLAVITRTAGILGLRLLQTSAEYKSFAYVYRITRSLSICTTSFLSMLQAITISPSEEWIEEFLKAQIPNVILLVLAILWIPNLLISTNLLYQVVASHNATSTESNCYVVPVRTLLQGLILILMALRDILSLGLMSCSSGYMHLHSTGQAPKTSPERRATETIVLLVSCFVVFYCADFLLSLFLGTSMKNNVTLMNISMFVVSGYATVSPFVLVTCDTSH
uniref:Vomeronasal type-1 receptor n=1 Tax=Ornithorhynchus anatinus TaxID=9258 RepID=F6UGI3_ORNAN